MFFNFVFGFSFQLCCFEHHSWVLYRRNASLSYKTITFLSLIGFYNDWIDATAGERYILRRITSYVIKPFRIIRNTKDFCFLRYRLPLFYLKDKRETSLQRCKPGILDGPSGFYSAQNSKIKKNINEQIIIILILTMISPKDTKITV